MSLELHSYVQLEIFKGNNNSIEFNSGLLMCQINSQKANYRNSTTYKHK
jgi:hypothetical protein